MAIQQLSKDILTTHIFPDLSGKDLARCMQVCKSWKDIVSNVEGVWKTFCQQEFWIAEKETETWKEQYVRLHTEIILHAKLFASGSCQKKVLKGHSETVSQITLDDHFLASSESTRERESSIHVWDLQNQISLQQRNDDFIDPNSISLRGEIVLFSSKNGTLEHHWNWSSQTDVTSEDNSPPGFKMRSVEGALIVTKTLKGIQLFIRHLSESLPPLDVSKKIAHVWLQGDFLITSEFSEHTITVMNAHSQQSLALLRGHTDYIVDISFQRNVLASGSQDGTVKVWNCVTQECLLTIDGEGDDKELNFRYVKVSLQGYLVAFAAPGKKSVVQIWNWRTKQCLHTLTETSGLNVVFYKNSVISSHGKNINIWTFEKKTSMINSIVKHLPFLSKK